ncbi:MAG: AAA family ATPase [Myxococcales bacterium]|nr:AAA family ATPase [Myxococcales bacterium]
MGQGHHKIRRLRVYGGFLDKLDLRLGDGLNCIIGGRGSGKTTVLEFIRYALDRLPKPTTTGKIADERLRSLLGANLGNTGCVEVEFESQEGLVYHLRRTAHEAPTITDERGKAVDPKVLASSILIDAAIFSHNEIEEIAQNPAAQRELLDRLCSQPLHALQGRIDQAAGALRENGQRLLQLAARGQSARQDLVDLSSWESKLAAADAAMADDGLSAGLKSAAAERSLREQESAALARARKTIGKLRDHLGDPTLAMIKGLGAEIPEAVEAGPNGALFGDLRRELKRRETELEILLSPVVDRLRDLDGALARASEEVQARHEPAEARYRALMQEADEHSARLSARDEAAAQVLRLSAAKGELVELDRAQAAAIGERRRLLDAYADLRSERFATRSRIAAEISGRLGGKVRVIVTADAEHGSYRDFLVGLMKKSGRQYNAPIERIVTAIAPTALGELADRNDHAALAATADVNADFAETLLHQLREHPERRLELDTIDREDVPRIELSVGDTWRSADRLSTGQKSSAILPILLLEGEAPLLIDQPEDNLDNSFISDAVIPQLREIKRQRQLIAITHNPNLPVLGDAERVIVMEADGRSSRAIAQDDLHGTKEHILRLMEGGWEAFRLRQERYERG